jgi:YHS domain-containing protein
MFSAYLGSMRTTVTLLLSICLFQTFAQSDAWRQKHFNVKKSVAIEGYDPVSYFDGNPVEGKPEIKTTHKGVVYQFATQANLKKFKTTPEQYEPAYGGWCAFAMGESGEKVKVDPETFKILNGKLYLFYNFWGNNTLSDWNKEESKLKESGDRNWKKFIQ